MIIYSGYGEYSLSPQKKALNIFSAFFIFIFYEKKPYI